MLSISYEARLDGPEPGLATIYGRPNPPDWRGMGRKFLKDVDRIWEVLAGKTYDPPFAGATREDAVRGFKSIDSWVRLPEECPEVDEILTELLRARAIRQHQGRYFVVGRKIHGKLVMIGPINGYYFEQIYKLEDLRSQ